MEKKVYTFPIVEITCLKTKELMDFTSEISGDGTPGLPVPARKPGHGGSEAPVF